MKRGFDFGLGISLFAEWDRCGRSGAWGTHPSYLPDLPDPSALAALPELGLRLGGDVVMLHVIETDQQNQQWLGVADIMRAEAYENANAALDRAAGRANRIAAITPERVIREGEAAEQILEAIEQDVDIAMLVLAASPGAEGPGPLTTMLAKTVGNFPIPVVIVPGDLSDSDLDALS